MDNKKYRKLMIAGLLPWRADVFTNNYRKSTDRDRMRRDGWTIINHCLKWKNGLWELYFKILSSKPKDLPGFATLHNPCVYVEYWCTSFEDEHAELYAYGNFLNNKQNIHNIKGEQVRYVSL